jgi:hypothetical protein
MSAFPTQDDWEDEVNEGILFLLVGLPPLSYSFLPGVEEKGSLLQFPMDSLAV